MYTRALQCDDAYRRLLHGRYGPPPLPPRPPVPLSAATTETADAGTDAPGAPQAPMAVTVDEPPEEYVVVRGEPPQQTVQGTLRDTVPDPGASPLPVSEARAPAAAGTGATDAPPSIPIPPKPQPALANEPSTAPRPEPYPAPPQGSETSPSPAEPLEGTVIGEGPASGHAVSEEDLAADMQAILTGRKVYDSSTGTMRDREGSLPPPRQTAPARTAPQEPPPPSPETSNEQSIFNRIAEQLEYSNSFDLGNHELQRRFDSFDQFAEQQSAAAPRRRRTAAGSSSGRAAARQPVASFQQSPPPAPAPSLTPSAPYTPTEQRPLPIPAADFRAVYERTPGPWSELAGRDAGLDAAAFAAAVAAERSTALFDTGEHVLAGEITAAASSLPVGGVTFSYGDIISMGDFFDSPDQLLSAAQSELSTLKRLIDQSTAYYRSSTGPNPVSNEDWDRATGGRYLQLAEDNYTHFAPVVLIGESFATRHRDHRSAWEDWHERAIRAAHEEHARAGQSSPALTTPMTVNAFGDHFLTDAFAAGHLINKELVIDRFRRAFFTGSSLNTAGKSFFAQVAQKAFVGRVAERFSDLETTSYPVCAGGFCIPWRPNINSVSRFTTLLETAAEQEPVKIANLAVKALHDHLNATGVRVVNQAGDPEWTLHGDGHMDTTTLTVVRKAVGRSVADLMDPAIMASHYNVQPLLDRVWSITPHPTAAGTAQLRSALQDFTDPNSARLVDAAAGILTEQLDATISVLLASGQLKPA